MNSIDWANSTDCVITGPVVTYRVERPEPVPKCHDYGVFENPVIEAMIVRREIAAESNRRHRFRAARRNQFGGVTDIIGRRDPLPPHRIRSTFARPQRSRPVVVE